MGLHGSQVCTAERFQSALPRANEPAYGHYEPSPRGKVKPKKMLDPAMVGRLKVAPPTQKGQQ